MSEVEKNRVTMMLTNMGKLARSARNFRIKWLFCGQLSKIMINLTKMKWRVAPKFFKKANMAPSFRLKKCNHGPPVWTKNAIMAPPPLPKMQTWPPYFEPGPPWDN